MKIPDRRTLLINWSGRIRAPLPRLILEATGPLGEGPGTALITRSSAHILSRQDLGQIDVFGEVVPPWSPYVYFFGLPLTLQLQGAHLNDMALLT